jgi:hypothetical protein
MAMPLGIKHLGIQNSLVSGHDVFMDVAICDE